MSSVRKKLSPLTVIGELLLLAGLGVFGFILWQPWYTTTVVSDRQANLASAISAQWQEKADTTEKITEGIPVAKADGTGAFGIIYVPAFGREWANQLVSSPNMNKILDNHNYGIAHYNVTRMPGAVGNVALAAHRTGGITTPFHDIDYLRVGDPVFIETADGWYTYRFRDYEYVLPNAVDVLNAFPHLENVEVKDSILTFTTCNPKYYGTDERMIAYSVLESFTPRSSGPPAELLKTHPNIVHTAAGNIAGAKHMGGN